MFVYQNKDGHICVTFKDNKPVTEPEYVIAVDDDAKALYMVSGTIEKLPTTSVEETVETPVIHIPAVDELDDVVENDHRDEPAESTTADYTGAPTYEEIRPKVEDEPVAKDKEATLTDAEHVAPYAPTIEELDAIEENDPVEEESEAVEDEAESTEE